MFKKTLSVLILIFPLIAISSENCSGKVVAIIDYPGVCLDSANEGHIAFYLDTIGGTSGPAICSLSDRSDAMILTAYASAKPVSPRLDLVTPGDCNSITQWQKPRYLSIQ